MKPGWALLVLLLAAALEAGGDALVRAGLFGPGTLRRAGLIIAGGLVLLLYGCVVNAPRWDFGRLLGIYVVFFFVVAQIIAWIGFHQRPTLPIWIGGVLIIIGGLVISLGKS
jgi:drug/metabolite transporter superfamily protein YnfA